MTNEGPVRRGEIVEECGANFEVFALPTDEGSLLSILTDCFEEWEHICIGPLIPGAIWEIRPTRKPVIALLDGYATVDFQDWHLHICIGEHGAVAPEIAKLRRTNCAELYRRLGREGEATSWGLRFLNGAGNQQINFMLQSPFLSEGQQLESETYSSRLTLWKRLRQRCVANGSGHVERVSPRLKSV